MKYACILVLYFCKEISAYCIVRCDEPRMRPQPYVPEVLCSITPYCSSPMNCQTSAITPCNPCGAPTTCSSCGATPTTSCNTCGETPSTCSSCGATPNSCDSCGLAQTTCNSCGEMNCQTCGKIDACSKCGVKNIYFPEVEYPMTVFDSKPFFYRSGWTCEC
ncbi:keratin-associated protein 5-2-like [Colias croceus]|uniref:keratin-associated protein 5-2-like n=1 Tax=Colias crocea TaxID=72248 RepID=UPI001E27BAAD|nr:keratin-associated protein 5-2-like [Colias croceus]